MSRPNYGRDMIAAMLGLFIVGGPSMPEPRFCDHSPWQRKNIGRGRRWKRPRDWDKYLLERTIRNKKGEPDAPDA